MKLINKSLFFLLLLVGALYSAEVPPVPLPPGDGDGGGGTGGTGSPASPIDMYIYALVLVGFLFIVYFNKAKQKKMA